MNKQGTISALIVATPLACMLTLISSSVAASSCKSDGSLNYLGRTADNANSVWLSTTQTGSFALEEVKGKTRVDTWSRSIPYPRVSLSPFVSNGSGGTHQLLELGTGANGKDCLVDNENQKNGIVFPPSWPGIIRPPMGIKPPIGTLPPTGLTPGVPIMPSPPIGVLPPIGVTPGVPVMPNPPTTLSPASAVAQSGSVPRCTEISIGESRQVPCDLEVAPVKIILNIAPITPGRDLAPPSVWNFWSDIRFSKIDDNRHISKLEMDNTFVGIGIDRAIAENMVIGLQFESEHISSKSFGRLMSVDTSTFSVGPYFSALVNPHWSVSGMLTYGQLNSDLTIAGLDGTVKRNRTRAVLTAAGQYDWNEYNFRPRFSFDYSYLSSGKLALDGTVLNKTVKVLSKVPAGWSGSFSPTIEVSRVFESGNDIWVPYTEVGATYSFGETSNGLFNSKTSYQQWAGILRLGLRARTESGLLLDASLGYNSLFQKNLDNMDASLSLSWNF
ncbi:MAG: autotransporter domain-containing protein [Oceanospirillaceae bacterium]|nr:autotransporter domain-containing protein [Oceanospirillaceae bacterium]